MIPPMSEQTTLAVVHASVGSGHKVAAEAIAGALEQLGGGSLNIQVLDILDYGNVRVDGNSLTSTFTGPTSPFYDILWRYTFTGRILWGGGAPISRRLFSRFTDWVSENRPAAVICTHATGSNIAVGSRIQTHIDYPVISVPTDYEVHGLWPHKYTDLFCVGTDRMADTLRRRRVEESRIAVTGIPARQEFSLPHDRAAIRAEYGLREDDTVILTLAGANVPGPYVKFKKTLLESLPALKYHKDVKFVTVCGHDDAYANELRSVAAEKGYENLIVLGYIDDMASLMAASDLVICKPGGLTCTECLYAEAPMILLGKACGQERANVEMLTRIGAAISVESAEELAQALATIFSEKDSLSRMRGKGSGLRRPDAAMNIARASLELASSRTTDEELRRRFSSSFPIYIGDAPDRTDR